MLELARGLCLALEALHEGGVERQHCGKHLDRDFAVERPLTSPIHDRHPAAPQLLENVVISLERGAHAGDLDFLRCGVPLGGGYDWGGHVTELVTRLWPRASPRATRGAHDRMRAHVTLIRSIRKCATSRFVGDCLW